MKNVIKAIVIAAVIASPFAAQASDCFLMGIGAKKVAEVRDEGVTKGALLREMKRNSKGDMQAYNIAKSITEFVYINDDLSPDEIAEKVEYSCDMALHK